MFIVFKNVSINNIIITFYFSYVIGPLYNRTEFNNFRKFRYNHLQRHYDNVWMWRDINIGPHGRFIFDLDVPHRPANWMITAFSLSPSKGFGMIKKPIEVS